MDEAHPIIVLARRILKTKDGKRAKIETFEEAFVKDLRSRAMHDYSYVADEGETKAEFLANMTATIDMNGHWTWAYKGRKFKTSKYPLQHTIKYSILNFLSVINAGRRARGLTEIPTRWVYGWIADESISEDELTEE